MTHSFDTELAQSVGLEGAIILQNIEFWINKNRANRKNFINGYFWTYNTYDAWAELFPYMKINTIKRVLKKLQDMSLIAIESGLNPRNKWDKTNYYRLSDNYSSIVRKMAIEETQKASSNQQEYNDVHTDIKQQIINSDKKIYKKENEEFTSTERAEAVEVVNKLYDYRQVLDPSAKINPHSWIKDILLAIKNDGRTKHSLIDCLSYVFDKKGTYWIPIIKNGKKLREHYKTIELQAINNTTKKKEVAQIDIAREVLMRKGKI